MTEGFDSRVARYDMTQCNTGTGIDFVSFITVIFEMRADWLGGSDDGGCGGRRFACRLGFEGGLASGPRKGSREELPNLYIGTNLGGCGAGGSVKCNLWEFGSNKRRKKIQSVTGG